ncbi:RCC1 domain-containing protein [Acetivibrio cellulolyticus]|uniref:RCC1 domain-containing protein n=1 Tax=Acetivibrio cellulolyticus TaxID=35830 RepID=UPI0013C3422F
MLSGVKAICASYRHVLALKDDGAIVSFGCNNYGQLGNGSSSICYFSASNFKLILQIYNYL